MRGAAHGAERVCGHPRSYEISLGGYKVRYKVRACAGNRECFGMMLELDRPALRGIAPSDSRAC